MKKLSCLNLNYLPRNAWPTDFINGGQNLLTNNEDKKGQ
jgi:hypothetical protein